MFDNVILQTEVEAVTLPIYDVRGCGRAFAVRRWCFFNDRALDGDICESG